MYEIEASTKCQAVEASSSKPASGTRLPTLGLGVHALLVLEVLMLAVSTRSEELEGTELVTDVATLELEDVELAIEKELAPAEVIRDDEIVDDRPEEDIDVLDKLVADADVAPFIYI